MNESEIHVVQTSEGWTYVPMSDAENAIFDTQHDAVLAAVVEAQQSKREIIIHDSDGAITKYNGNPAVFLSQPELLDVTQPVEIQPGANY
jgi:hypothetical protein